MTDHSDIGVDKRILRERVGHVHPWVFSDTDQSVFEDGAHVLGNLQTAVFVTFHDKDGEELPWTLPGMTEAGVYPITVRSSTWYVDKGRPHPMLGVNRKQFLRTPACSMTAPAAHPGKSIATLAT